MLEKLLKDKKMSVYKCSKQSGIPYTTLLEIVRGKTNIAKCTAEVVYKLSLVLDVSMEDLLSSSSLARCDFEIFKSNVCHRVKNAGELDFIISAIKEDDVRRFWNKKWYPEAFYTLAMVDYLSRLNEIPLCTKYNDIRLQSLSEPLLPKDVAMALKLHPSLNLKEKCIKEAIPEFLRFNIVESEISNVF